MNSLHLAWQPTAQPPRQSCSLCIIALSLQCRFPPSRLTSPTSVPLSARNDIGVVERLGVSVAGCERMLGVGPGLAGPGLAGPGLTGPALTGPALAGPARYSPHHAQLLAQLATRGSSLQLAARSSSSSAESVSAASLGSGRVRTLYACLGESEGELSFEPNQIITNVAPSGEPGWLRGTLNGKTGLVPENYVEPLP
ncbi:hypothetical protein SFRURICE_016599 [Spodoptera frugiperda]|nr:hypothetical protein SFRURICE_016599 [Spodoptera frugiperda]